MGEGRILLPGKEAANTRASINTLSDRRKQGEMEKQQQKGQGGGERAEEFIP